MILRRSCEECTVTGAHCFCSLNRDALGHLDQMGTEVRYTAGERVVEEGAAAERICIVCHGTLKLTTSSRAGRLLLLRILGPGDVLGLASALKGTPYEATAEALETCDVRIIARTDFLHFVENFKGVGLSTAEAVAREYGSAVLSARRLALSGSAAGKLASVLLDWGRMSRGPVSNHAGEAGAAARAPGKKALVEAALRFRMPLTHEELGHMAGISRETATRVLTKLKGEGLVEMEGERMVLQAPERLERLYC
jgi:CRP/FNR family transcriptional regulator